MFLKNFGKGQALTEYALPVAVIVLASVPALIMLGGNLQAFTKETSVTVMGDPQAALKAAAQLEAESRWAEASTTKGLGPYQGKYNVHNGNISIKVPSFLGGGHANFSEGTGMTRSLSARLKRLAAEYRDEHGEPLPSELRKRIEKLAAAGKKLAKNEAAFNRKKEKDKQGKPSDYMDIIRSYQDFYQEFNSVKAELNRQEANGANYGEVKDIVRGYSGIISANAYANYTDRWDKGERKYTAAYNTKKYLVGEQPQRTVSRNETPGVTHHGSKEIGSSM